MGFITLSNGRKVLMKKNHYSNYDKREFWRDLPKDERLVMLRKTPIADDYAKELSKKQWKTVDDSPANTGASYLGGYLNFIRDKYNNQK